MKPLILTASLALAATPAAADDAFVEANVLTTLYHELGHAIIDVMQLPVFGQEEDGADVLSILLVDALYEEDSAISMAYDTAQGFLAEEERRASEGSDVAFWDVHGPDLQRYFNTVCLFYGANPDSRDDVAAELGLPAERADGCPDEFALAADSWGPVLDEMAALAAAGQGHAIGFGGGAGFDFAWLVADEVAALADEFHFPEPVTVFVDQCNEINAFYIPDERAIIICTEYVDYLTELGDALY